MKCQWQNKTWGDIATLEYGKGLRDYKESEGQYPVFGTNGQIGWHTEPLCPHPGVIVGRKGAYRGIHYSDQPFYVIDTAFYLVPTEEIDLKWAYYQLLTVDINSMDSGTAIPSTSRDAFYQIPVKVPPLPEQRAIAEILGSLDDKIELNRQMNATLEAIARAIFTSWFVDFDPVQAKARGEAPAGMDAATAALFPDTFVESVLGPIPVGWKVGEVKDLGTIVLGKTPSTRDPNNYGGTIPFIRIPDMRGEVFVIETNKYLSNEGSESQYKKELPPYSICVSCIASPGIVAMTSCKSHTNQQINSIVPKNGVSPYYCYFSMKDLGDMIKARGSGGSVYLNLSKSKFSVLPVLLPPYEIMERYQRVVSPLMEGILSNKYQSQTLADLRDTLLPKLISGELRVPEFMEKKV